MRFIKYLLIFLLVLCLLPGCGKKQQQEEKVLEPGVYAKMETSKGSFIIQLEYKKVPMLVANFVGLAEGVFQNDLPEDTGFFDSTSFFEIIKGILVKGGKPTGRKRSLPGYNLPDNFDSTLLHDRIGAISMLQTDGKISANEFSIALKQVNWLDYKQPVFGYVVDGMEILDKLSARDKLKKVTILRIGDNAAAFNITKETFDTLKMNVEKANLEAEDTLHKNALATLRETYPDLHKTNEGSWFTILKQGAGPIPPIGTEVLVKYKGTLMDKTVFMDTSGEEGGMKRLTLGKVIKGLDGALQTMRKGEHRIVVIPPELGFGEAGLDPLIPPNAFLIFDVELIDF